MSGSENTSPPKETIQEEKEISKQSLRRQVWELLNKNKVSTFPRPFGRIPNFKGADLAAAKLLELEEFCNAKSVEINPDKPLEHSRILALEQEKELYVPIPRLKNCLLKKLKKDEETDVKKIISRWGIEHMGEMIDLNDPVHIDLFVLGSVAVSKQGYRIGKGRGYADLEFAILKEMKAVNNNTVIVTTVHDLQVFDELPVELFQKYDVPVDYILTPTQIIKVEKKLPRPEKIFWEILSKRRVNMMKTLQILKEKHKGEGIETTLKEEDSDVDEGGRVRKFRKPFRKNSNSNSKTDKENSNPRPDRKYNGRRFYRRKSGSKNEPESSNETEKRDTQDSENSPKRRKNPRRPYRRFHIDYSLMVSNIERNVRVRDLKNALIKHGIKPDDITWKGYKGFCYLHYAKPTNKATDKENESQKPFSVDNVIDILQSLKLTSDSQFEVKVMEPITRIETTDVTSVAHYEISPSLMMILFVLSVAAVLPGLLDCDGLVSVRKNQVLEIKKHLKRLRKEEGAIKLVGGRGEFEGNVEILHNGTWGAICDDEWDTAEAQIICKQLGYDNGIAEPTVNSYFGPAKRRYWMDNIYCSGTEHEIHSCRFDGWGENDCSKTEAAGVICVDQDKIIKVDSSNEVEKVKSSIVKIPKVSKIRLRNGRIDTEGRVEIKSNNGKWEVMCGDGWSLLEAMIVCKMLNLGYANDAMQTDYFGGNLTSESMAGVKCLGNENSLSQCTHDADLTGKCKSKDVAAVSCTPTMADLVLDHIDLMRTAHLEDKQMFFLTCAMEENCVASSAYEIQRENNAWHLETRRLLRFTARTFNAGTADFRPIIPKNMWEWHMCHMHYHSMEVFATFDIYNEKNERVAEGHKASFCLEDNQCLPGVKPRFACANFGDQGISVNCSDIYKYTVDCQWVDISDLEPGKYTMKVAINPEFKIPEMSYDNNAAVCDFLYTETFGSVTNCTVVRP
ncbi:unnamed protein product [Brassicogethes aeneus]|uniref:Methenyltetrahydrofolate synthase domain-containing protein n=1 Tax=Brassicogethes aeneus TaxID=1431903 RepID=A0A9P0B1H2_BRAAE|nr:unnamed protein product [Brassicogethes aeneus]